MEKYKKYEFIQNTNNKELNELFENPSYNEIEKRKKDTQTSLNEHGYADASSIDIIGIISVFVMIVLFLLLKVIS